MGRIRTVKPELFLHDELHDIEKETGLPVIRSFIGLFTVCDRSGRFVWKPRILKTQIAPYDDIDFSQVMDALKSAGFILHYQVDGREYGCIPTWEEHQTINNREADSKIPAHDEGVVLAQEASPPCTTNLSTRQVQDRDASLQCTTKPTTRQVQDRDASLQRTTKPITRQEKDCDASLQCTSMHKYAQGEGKGREGKGRGKEREGEKTCRAEAQPLPADEAMSGELLPAQPPSQPSPGKSSPEKSSPEKPPPKKTGANASEQITDVFRFWQQVLNHPQAKLDDKRKKNIHAALKTGYSVDDLKTAIIGCNLTPFNQGDNEQGQKYDGLHVIFKNADQIDRFIHTALNQGVINENRERYIEQHAPTGVSRPFTAKDFDLTSSTWRQYGVDEDSPDFN